MKKVIVFSLGGSLIVPDSVDYRYLHRFKLFVKRLLTKYNVVIVTGGGKTARRYIEGLKKEKVDDKFYSLVGIMATKLNARLVAGVFGLNEQIPDRLSEVRRELNKHNIVVCGALGFQPNMTSDGDAAEIAEYLKAEVFVNLTNVDGLYDKDPRRYKNSKIIECISYKDFLIKVNKIKYKAGQHFVLDQAAAKIISRAKIKTLIINGKKLDNLFKYFNKKNFLGTVIG